MPRPHAPSPRVAALSGLIDETRALFHRLRVAAEEAHGDGAPSAGRRGVLVSLSGTAGRTVPDLARERSCSRQHVQVLVDGLLEDGLVERRANPAHARSPLLALTPAGRRRLRTIEERERHLLGALRVDATVDDLQAARKTLRALREAFEGTRWARVLENES